MLLTTNKYQTPCVNYIVYGVTPNYCPNHTHILFPLPVDICNRSTHHTTSVVCLSCSQMGTKPSCGVRTVVPRTVVLPAQCYHEIKTTTSPHCRSEREHYTSRSGVLLPHSKSKGFVAHSKGINGKSDQTMVSRVGTWIVIQLIYVYLYLISTCVCMDMDDW